MSTLDTINIGAAPNDGTGDTIRDGGNKINSNFTNLNNDKAESVDGIQIYYVGKNGNDSNDGLTTEKAFLTFGAAITAASAQTPSSVNRFALYANDAGIYTENIIVPEFITIKATNVTLVGNLTVTDNQSIRICTINKLIRTTGTGTVFVDACRVATPDSETGVLNSSTGMLILKSRRIDAPLNGIGINNTSTGHIHCEVNHLALEGNNAIGIQTNLGTIVGSIEIIDKDGTPTTTTALKIVDGHIDINSSEITADTAYNVAASKILTLSVGELIGTKTVAAGGDAQISEAAKSTDDLAATGLVNGTGIVTINVDTTKLDITDGVYYIQGTRYVYAGGTAIIPTIAGGDTSTWVGLDSSGLIYSASAFSSAQKQTIPPLARLQAVQGESGPGSNLQSPIDLRFVISESGYLQLLWHEEAIGVLYNTGGTYSESSTALQVDQSAGKFYDSQRKPLNITASTNITAKALYHISGSWSLQTDATLVTPKFYDNQTDLVALPNNNWASHTILRSIKEEDSFVLVYSQAVYSNQADAEAAGIDYGLFASQASGFVAVASIIIKGDATNINNIVDRRPFAGGNNPGVIGTATNQQVRDNSSSPEVVTDSTRGAMTWKRGSAADTDDVLEILNGSDVQTFSVDGNGKINTRVNTIASSATPTPVGDTTDEFTVTALAANATFAAPTGTPTEGQVLLIRIKDDGTARTLAWNAIYRDSIDLVLPTTTIISKTLYLQFVYNNTDSKWDLLGLLNNF